LEEIEEIKKVNDLLEEKGIFHSKKLFKCILGLNELEADVLSYLLKHERVGTTELTQFFNVDRSSIQRVLQNLTKLDLIKRKSMSIKRYEEMKGSQRSNKRGYLYVYMAKNIAQIKKTFKNLLDKWYSSMIKYVDDLDSLFDCFETNGDLC